MFQKVQMFNVQERIRCVIFNYFFKKLKKKIEKKKERKTEN